MHLLRSSVPILLPSALLLASPSLAAPYIHDAKHDVSYQGITTSPGVETFLGIPYGESTAGSNRFAPPRPFSPSRGHVFNATVEGASCPQNIADPSDPESPVTDIDEDCLNLNVGRLASTKSSKELLPVLVWIYGGGLNTGSANDASTAPDGLLQQAEQNGSPVVFVAMNYRLNIFGFATSEALRGSKSLNNGLRDQRLAIEWVRENIEAFGGDPERITIFGQSSGGLSVGMQVLAYGARVPVPFHSAIMQSTALEPGMSSNITFNTTAGIAAQAGCINGSSYSDFAPNSPSQSPEVISCLRSLPMETLLNITNNFLAETAPFNDGDVFLPTVDQDFLPELASSLLSSGKFPKMPLIIGWEENDATLFTTGTIETSTDTRDFISLYYPNLEPDTLSTLLSLYPSGDFQPNTPANRSAEFYRSAEIFRDVLFVCPSFLFGDAMAKKYSNSYASSDSSSNHNTPPVYYYDNNQTLIADFLAIVGHPGLGIPHGSELSYVFGNISSSNFTNLGIPGYEFNPTASDYALVKQMPRSWANFAWTDHPSQDGKDTLPGWENAYPAAEGGGVGNVYVSGGTHEGMAGACGEYNGGIRKERLVERCTFLNSPHVIRQLKY